MKLEFVVCRQCKQEYAKWYQPYCRKCWKKYFKNRYIPTKEELQTYAKI